MKMMMKKKIRKKTRKKIKIVQGARKINYANNLNRKN
jgi:hypothetical protein